MFTVTLPAGRPAIFSATLALAAMTAPLANAQTPVEVIAEEAARVQFVDRIEALGTLQANEMVVITALVTERIETIHFDDGDQVEEGQVLVEFARGEEDALLEEARAAREEALEQFERASRLIERGTTTEAQLSLRRREFSVADARTRAVEAQIADRVIRAPFSGTIGIRTISVGATVSPGDIITRLADTSVMKLDFSVPSTFLGELVTGVPIEATTRSYGEEVFRGTIASVDSVVDPVTRSVLVRATLPNPDGRLRPGQLMEVDLLFNTRHVIAVSEEALIPSGADMFVLVVAEQDGGLIVTRRQVEIGARRVGQVEIVSGLEPGERIITRGALKVRPGQPVSVRTSGQVGGAPSSTTGNSSGGN